MLSPIGRVFSKLSPPSAPPSEEETLLQLERELFEALREKDIIKLNRLLPDDFCYRSPHQRDLPKHEFLAEVQSFPLRITRLWPSELKVTIYEQTAVLNGVQAAKLVNHRGKSTISSTAFTDVFVQRQGRWQLVSSYGVELPEQTPGR